MPRIVAARKLGGLKLEKPFRLIVAGGFGCGKSEFVRSLVEKNYFSSKFDKIIYNYPDYLDELKFEFENPVEYKAGLIDQEYVKTCSANTLIIIDDLQKEVAMSVDIHKLMSVSARKKNISVIIITQNIYDSGKYFRDIRLNATAFALFKFHAGTDVNKRLVRELGLSDTLPEKLMRTIYNLRYSYILINIHQNRQYDFGAITGNIFSESPNVYYKMKYYAITEADFLKYFNILESKKGTVKGIKNATEIKKNSECSSKKRQKVDSDSSSSESEFDETDSE